jgi:general secretion pathway protein I
VVVAFAILALSLGVLLQIFSSAVRATALSGTYSRAATLAEERLNSVGLEIPLAPGAEAGETEDGFQWQVFIDYFDPGAVDWEATLQPYLVTSVVSWETAGGSRQVTLSTLRLGELL